MMMGFPTHLPDTSPPSLCVCHAEIKTEGFLCPRCLAKLCDVPTDCDICGLMIVSSPHLARSYHHLFPVKTFDTMYVASSFAAVTFSLEVDSRPIRSQMTLSILAMLALGPFHRRQQ